MVLLCSCSIICLFEILKYFFLLLVSQLMNNSSGFCFLYVLHGVADVVVSETDLISYWSVLYLFCSEKSFLQQARKMTWGKIKVIQKSKQELE